MTHRLTILPSIAAPVFLLLSAAPAIADGDRKPPEDDDPYADEPDDDPYADLKPGEPQWLTEKRREKLFREGKRFVEERRWKEAIERFRAVESIRSDPRVLLWRGFSEEGGGQLLDARKTYLQAKKDAAGNAKFKQAEQDADAALSALGPKIPRLVLHLPPQPAPVIKVDGGPVTPEKGQIEVDPGDHKLTVLWPNIEPFDLEAKAMGEGTVLTVSLPPFGPPPSPQTPRGPQPSQPASVKPLRVQPPVGGACCSPMVGAPEPTNHAAVIGWIGLAAALTARRRRFLAP